MAEVILFKPAIIHELAKEAGIEPEALDLLKEHNCTTASELKERLGLKDDTNDPPGHDETITTNGQEPNGVEIGNRAPAQASETSTATIMPTASVTSGDGKHTVGSASSAVRSDAGAQRKFVSYVEVGPSEETEDPDDQSHQKRMDLERQAIDLICSKEPVLQRTPTHNPGFDLTELGSDGKPVRWIEVKAMKGTLKDRPVTLTRRQFKFAQDYKDAYWIYIVEKADDSSQINIIRVKDPAGKAQTFTFDHGWGAVAEVPN